MSLCAEVARLVAEASQPPDAAGNHALAKKAIHRLAQHGKAEEAG